ncbi:MAG: hydantoinase B/oxoprolinase family protein [Chloroflexi bacterium]|nr:hydantoinase B/oxoprolinase family protein [Chloroflexota bacterium]
MCGGIFDQSEALARAAVRAIPDGEYRAEAFMDDDGVNLGKHLPVKVRVVVADDCMTVDLTDCSRQVTGPYNSGKTAGRSAAEVAFKFLTSPLLLPINEGSFRPLTVVLPPGRIVSAQRPAPVRTWMTVPQTVADTIFKALAPACPERVMAGHHTDLATVSAFVTDAAGRVGMTPPILSGGGWGAVSDADGQNATFCINDGDTHNTPVEAAEGKAPVLIMHRALRPDSGGPGRFRGGLGVSQDVRVLTQGRIQSGIERTMCPPWGAAGGREALANRISLLRANGKIERFPTGKIGPADAQPGDGYLVEVGGGGGFGSPLDREPERVLADVRSGYVSIARALVDYGVVVEHIGRLYTVDRAATEDARRRRSA